MTKLEVFVDGLRGEAASYHERSKADRTALAVQLTRDEGPAFEHSSIEQSWREYRIKAREMDRMILRLERLIEIEAAQTLATGKGGT